MVWAPRTAHGALMRAVHRRRRAPVEDAPLGRLHQYHGVLPSLLVIAAVMTSVCILVAVLYRAMSIAPPVTPPSPPPSLPGAKQVLIEFELITVTS